MASMQSLVKRHGPRRNDDNKRQLQTIGKINDKDNNYTPIYKTNKNVRKGVKNINRKMRNKIKIDRQTKNNSWKQLRRGKKEEENKHNKRK